MSKKRVSDRVDETELRRGGLAETNVGILLGDIVVSRSWTAVIAIIIFVSIFVRAAVGLGGYSGLEKPPMHGDFEAQRHWLELTLHVPLKEWYFHDLQWWGLDYPPLTAYISLFFAKIGNVINPTWFELYKSRGSETPALKAFMRFTVIISDLVLYIPVAISYVLFAAPDGRKIDKAVALTLLLLQPCLLLVDHGHFQYNSIMLGLFLLSLTLLSLPNRRPVLAAIPFVLSLCFKQMALYYAPAIFIYLLSLSFPRLTRPNIPLLFSLGIAVIATFSVMLVPFALPRQVLDNLISTNFTALTNPKIWAFNEWDVKGVQQVFIRVFPFGRGLWEDKVANSWCATNILIKWRQLYSTPTLQKLSLLATLASISPGLLYIAIHPLVKKLPAVFTISALGFFLFSFQVHEKSILLPLLPASLSLLSPEPEDRKWTLWINVIGTISLWPLLKKDGLALQYFIFLPLWVFLGYESLPTNLFTRFIHVGSILALVVGHIVEAVWIPPERFPDVLVLWNVTICWASFVIYWTWLVCGLWKDDISAFLNRQSREKKTQ